jgi:molybdenum cofactor cytidylyltransferase
MGGNKLLIDIGGRAVFEITLGNHLASSLDGVCAVVPGWNMGFKEIAGSHEGDRVTFLMMDEPCAMSDSLKAGWRWILDNTGAGGVMISLADQPLIGPGTLDILIDGYRAGDKPICIPTCRGRRGHPVIIGRELDGVIMGLEGDRGARDILTRRPELVAEIEVGSDEILLDLDRTGDLQVIKARLEGRG